MKKLILFFSLLVAVSLQSQSWVPIELNTTKNLKDVYFLNGDNGWIVGDEGVIFRYYDQSWHEMDAGITEGLNSVFMIDTNNVWMAGVGGKIVNYTTAGFQLYNSPTTKSLNDIYMLNPTKGWIVGETGTLLVYDGLNWDFEYIEPPNFWDTNHLVYDDLRHIDFVDEDFGAITGEWGSYLEYRNGWKDLISQNTQSFVSVSIVDTNLVYISGFENNPLAQTHYIFTHGGGGFLYFNDQGPDWINSFKIIENKGWAVVSNGNILKYNELVFEMFENHGVALNSLSLLNDSTGWIIGNSGKVLHLNTALDLPENDNPDEILIFPNPSTGMFAVSGLNINGICVQHQLGQTIIAGKETIIDLSDFPDGLYILKVNTNHGVITRKLVKKN